MIANHIHDALGQVRRLQALVLAKRRFRGYSGIARMAGGVAALSAACLLSLPGVPANASVHLITWGIVLVIALGVNYGALALWFWCDPQVHRNPSHLLPAGDAIPALLAGGMISYALLRAGTLGPLFGVWMCCYGLAHVAHRASLPRANYLLGWFYLFCGGGLFLRGNPSFLNPWPMGMIFFIGELLGGITLIRLDKQSGKGGPDGDR